MNLVEQSTDFCKKYLSCLKRASSRLNISQSQSLCLSSIPFDGISQTDLAKKLSLDISTLSRNLDRLMAQGIIERNSSLYDKRTTRINLTESGHKVYADLNLLIKEELDRVFAKFDVDEQNQISEMLNRINWSFELVGK